MIRPARLEPARCWAPRAHAHTGRGHAHGERRRPGPACSSLKCAAKTVRGPGGDARGGVTVGAVGAEALEKRNPAIVHIGIVSVQAIVCGSR